MRVMSYNIRRAFGSDSSVSLRRIANVIAREAPDAVGLNEVWRLPVINDQPQRLAAFLSMEAVFQDNVPIGPAMGYGNLVLSPWSMEPLAEHALPGGFERRGVVFARIVVDGMPIIFGVTHLGLSRALRARQLAFIAESLPEGCPVVLVGDLNAGAEELAPLLGRLNLVEPLLTYPSVRPRMSLDHVLYSDHFTVRDVHSVSTRGSDHLPVIVDLDPRV